MSNLQQLRIYNTNNNRVYDTYKQMHKKQTVLFVRSKQVEYSQCNKCSMTIKQALNEMNLFVDDSDPDFADENIYHCYQTAEAIRKVYPNEDWYQLIGLIHDVGKVLYKFGEPQWSIVGDTYPVGCKPSQSIVYPETFYECSDQMKYPYYYKYGMYTKNCGLQNLLMSWGHDEYLSLVLRNNINYLPSIGIDIIKYHSFYPWHTNGEYSYFMNNYDHQLLQWIKDFNSFDLYSKVDKFQLTDEIIQYYDNLIDKYCPGYFNF